MGSRRNDLQHDTEGGTDIRQIGPCLQADGHKQFIAIIGMAADRPAEPEITEPARPLRDLLPVMALNR